MKRDLVEPSPYPLLFEEEEGGQVPGAANFSARWMAIAAS